VPLVEANPLAGLANNVDATRAVRPINVMGASKRVAELVVQAHAQLASQQGLSTRFAMVRFGNVLGSSGSVVPLFRQQIAAGGPITLTHPQLIHYFSGLTLRDEHNSDGDIAIECTGLRPGEKLYEELLIEADSEPTTHPLIYRAREAALPPEALWPQLDALEAALRTRGQPEGAGKA
jgi:FlaA1/EpsC-like NDP-sugar epimerase